MATQTRVESGIGEDYDLLTFDDVTALTGVSKATISRACSSGHLEHVRFGPRAVRVRREALSRFIAAGGVRDDE